MKKQYIKPTTEVIILGTDDICDDYGIYGGSQNPTSSEGFVQTGKGTSWEDDEG